MTQSCHNGEHTLYRTECVAVKIKKVHVSGPVPARTAPRFLSRAPSDPGSPSSVAPFYYLLQQEWNWGCITLGMDALMK